MKRFLLTAASSILAISMTPVLANYNMSHEGSYVGLALGSALVTASPGLSSETIYNNFTSQFGNFATDFNEQHIMKGNIFRGEVYVGYGFAWQQLALSAEIFVGLQHYKESTNLSNVGSTTFEGMTYSTYNTTTVQIKPWHSGLDFRPGFILNPATLLYGRIGFSFNNVKLTSVERFYTSDPTVPEANLQTLYLSKNRNKVALRLGVGLEEHITDELSIRTDYIFSDYGRLSLEGSTFQGLPSGNSSSIAFSTAGRVIDNALLISMLYSFC